MIAYWDSSALVSAFSASRVKKRLVEEGGVTRIHSLTEVFTTLTGGRLGFRVDAEQAAIMIKRLTAHLTIVGLTADETLAALRNAKSKGIRGARIHDFLHIAAALRENCTVVLTLNTNDFRGIHPELVITAP